MPYARKKRYNKKRYKKKYKTRSTGPSTLTLIKNPSIGGFPHSVFTRLKYVFNGTLNPGVAGINSVDVFGANNAYDPYNTGVGSQPRGFDQWMTLYDHFYVKRSKIRVEFHNGDSTYEVQVGVAIRDDNTTEGVPINYMEQNNKGGMLGRVGSSHNHLVVNRTFDYARQNFKKYTDEQNKGTLTASPSENGFYHIWCGSPWNQDAANTYYVATIYYDVLFTELKSITQS